MDNKVSELIQRTKDYCESKRSSFQAIVDQRRERVLIRLCEAAAKHGIELNSKILEERLRLAQFCRVSQSEAIADLAEMDGDFTSKTVWLEVKTDDEHSLWKGYVVDPELAEIHFVPGDDFISGKISTRDVLYAMEIFIKRICSADESEFISHIYFDASSSVGVGSTPLEALERAYSAMVAGKKTSGKIPYNVLGIVPQVLADEVLRKLAKTGLKKILTTECNSVRI